MTKQLSASLEDYLETIAALIAVDGHAHSKEIAAKLNVKMPSVTGALRQLEKLGYIVYNIHYPVELTPEGKRIAEEVTARHEALKKFFSDILGLPPEKASETACQVEHVVDADTIRRFVIFSEAIENRCDAKALQTYLTEAMSHLETGEMQDLELLSALRPGSSAKVIKIGRNVSAPLPFAVGNTLNIRGFSLDKSMLKLSCGNNAFELPLQLAENIYARAIDAD